MGGGQGGVVRGGGFTKVWGISVTYYGPDGWAKAFGASALAFSFAGRNLATWTKYRGGGPELNEAGQNNFTTAAFLTHPPVRHVFARVTLPFSAPTLRAMTHTKVGSFRMRLAVSLH